MGWPSDAAWTTRARRAVSAVLTLLLAGAVLAPSSGSPQPGSEDDVSVGADRVTVEGIRLALPRRGQSVWAEAVLADGGTRVVGVAVGADGTLTIRRSGPPAPYPFLANGDPCRDRAFAVEHGPWRKPFVWSFGVGGLPDWLSPGGAEEALVRAAANLTEGRNDCGLAPSIEVPMRYGGRTEEEPGVEVEGCLARDHQSVVGFGPLAPGYLAMTCWWVGPRGPLEADVKLSDAVAWAVRLPRRCSGRWSIEAVATHEFGHVLGLGHVGEGGHGALTMSPVIPSCQSAEATLGLGDVLGLERLY